MFTSGQHRIRRLAAGALLGSLVLLSACGGGDDDGGNEGGNASEENSTETTGRQLPEGAVWVAHAKGDRSEIPVYANDGDEQPAETIPNPNNNGVGQVFLVDGTDVSGDYIHVYLPVPPNQSQGWVKKDDVVIGDPVDYKIVIERGARKLTVFQGGNPIIETPAGVGRAGRETPTGTYFIRELLDPPSADGPYGPFAYGISGFSSDPEVLAEFGPDSSVGIHGTNDPSSVGQEVSSGCIRIPNDIITRLATHPDQGGIGLPLGTPVEIVE